MASTGGRPRIQIKACLTPNYYKIQHTQTQVTDTILCTSWGYRALCREAGKHVAFFQDIFFSVPDPTGLQQREIAVSRGWKAFSKLKAIPNVWVDPLCLESRTITLLWGPAKDSRFIDKLLILYLATQRLSWT